MTEAVKRFRITFLIMVMIAGVWSMPVRAAAAKPKLNAKSAIIMDMDTGKILFKKKIDTRRAPASMTKLMTASIALKGKNPDRKVRISSRVAAIRYNVIKYRKGERLYMRDLGYASLLASCCGSTKAMAEGVSGSTTKFVKLMNRQARKLGCRNTHFVNTYGLDNRKHYSTARDIALITRNAYKNKLIREILKTKTYKFRALNTRRRFTAYSTDQLLGSTTSCLGGKTGSTLRAGFCFASVYKYNGKNFVIVVMGCNKESYRWKDTIKLYNYIKKKVK